MGICLLLDVYNFLARFGLWTGHKASQGQGANFFFQRVPTRSLSVSSSTSYLVW